jgi:hypothetical protein
VSAARRIDCHDDPSAQHGLYRVRRNCRHVVRLRCGAGGYPPPPQDSPPPHAVDLPVQSVAVGVVADEAA